MRYTLYVDESGDHTYKYLDDIRRRYLGLVGIAIEFDYYRRVFQPQLEELKQLHFPHNPDEPLILHREDIYNRRYSFGVLSDHVRNLAWERDFIEFVRSAKFRLFTIIIDKKAHRERYEAAAIHPYHLCLTFLLERYRGYLTYVSGKGDVLAESRGAREDRALKAVYDEIWRNGTFYITAGQFQKVLTSRRLKVKAKDKNIAGLQLADLLAHPAKCELLISRGKMPTTSSFGGRLAEVFRNKYDLIGRKLLE